MNNIENLSHAVDIQVGNVRNHITNGRPATTLGMLASLAETIDTYRAEVAKEIEVLKGYVRSAEAAYDACNAASEGLANNIRRLTEDRNDWKADAAASEAKLEKALVERDEARAQLEEEKRFSKAMCERGDKHVIKIVELKKFIDRLQGRFSMREYMRPGSLYPAPPSDYWAAPHGKSENLNNGVPMYAMDPGAPEGDKTVITFECCSVKHTFSPPKLGNWHHESECRECGSKTSFGIS